MKAIRILGSTLAACAVLSLSACADMGLTRTQKDTAIGAAVGGVAGSVLTGGSTIGTLGGAAAGGLIGHEVGKR